MAIDKYETGDTFFLLLRPIDAMGALEDWLMDEPCDFILHRSKKNKGMVVLETQAVMFANRVRQWHPNARVSIKKADGTVINGNTNSEAMPH